jgi:SynChlorMet cassette protein ScmC
MADGFRWKIYGLEGQGSLLVSWLATSMRISLESSSAILKRGIGRTKKISVKVSNKKIRWTDFPLEHANEIPCLVGPYHTPEGTAFQLTRISQIVAHASEKNCGLLVHGALAEWNGQGVILAGPGGVGKTTVSKRLPSPWRSLSDDNTLIVRSSGGAYWAHPWPTWSQYRKGDMSGSWDVQAAVKLKAIFILTQARKNEIALLPIRQAISELVDVSGQTFFIMANGMDKDAIRRINLMRFHNAVALSKRVPVYRLEISRHGRFWKEKKILISLA